MNVIKIITYFVFCFPLASIGQEQKGCCPKDTIYVRFEHNKLNKKIIDWNYKEQNGVYFSIVDSTNVLSNNTNRYISLFYPYVNKVDTLSINNLKNYHFSDLKEIQEQRTNWVEKYFTGRFKPYDISRNTVFQTYLVEKISATQIVVYSVIWRNEGVVP